MKRSFYISRKKEGWEGKKEEVTEKGNKEGKVDNRQCCTILRNWKTLRAHHSTKLKGNNKLRKTLNSLYFISLFTKCCYWSVSCHYLNVPSFSENNWLSPIGIPLNSQHSLPVAVFHDPYLNHTSQLCGLHIAPLYCQQSVKSLEACNGIHIFLWALRYTSFFWSKIL